VKRQVVVEFLRAALSAKGLKQTRDEPPLASRVARQEPLSSALAGKMSKAGQT